MEIDGFSIIDIEAYWIATYITNDTTSRTEAITHRM
jgi:hypothetical protein